MLLGLNGLTLLGLNLVFYFLIFVLQVSISQLLLLFSLNI
jgi:hypothetical protein